MYYTSEKYNKKLSLKLMCPKQFKESKNTAIL